MSSEDKNHDPADEKRDPVPGAELDANEGADVLETREEAEETKGSEDEDDELITLDGSD
ncbi:hypothetical protein [Leucobacter sp. GX24907]